MWCIRCGSEETRRDGSTPLGGQRWRCSACGRRFTARSTSAFSRRAFPDDLIAVAMRWYARFRLSLADVVERLAERDITVDRSTVHRWVRRYLPLFAEAARPHRRPVSARWRVDETYLRLCGRWVYAYRAIDEAGQVVDETSVRPARVTTDKAGCYPAALRAVLPGAEHRTSKYLNNGLERDHGYLKQRARPMRGFKNLASADEFCRGHGLIQNRRNGFSALTQAIPWPLRLLTAWPRLAQMI